MSKKNSLEKFMKKKLSIIISLGLIVCMTTGCTTFNNFKNAFFSDSKAETTTKKERTIKIGVYEPLSGKYKEQGDQERIGIELAHELHPEVAGKKVELVYADNQSNMESAQTAIDELVAQQPSVILGSYGNTVTLIAGDAVKASNIPAIAITSTNPLITVNNPYYFCATFSEEMQGEALAQFVLDKQAQPTVATVKVSGDDAATPTIKRFTDRIKVSTENNESVVGSFRLATNSKDYTETLEAIKESGANTVFLDVSPSISIDFLKQAEEAKLTNVLYVGTSIWDDAKFLKSVQSSEKLNIAYTSDFNVKTHSTKMSETFIKAYKAKYGEDAEPTVATAVAYDSYLMALTAIQRAYDGTMALSEEEVTNLMNTDAATKGAKEEWEKAQETGIPTGKAIRDCLANLNDFEGASGVISYRGTNEATKEVTVNYILKGKIQEGSLYNN